VDGPVYEEYIVDYVLPSIAAKVPAAMKAGIIKLQQDNAGPHIVLKRSMKLVDCCKRLNLNIELVHQPSKSPDLNVLDLCFFNSLRSEYFQHELAMSREALI
jgi:hypothetical protein